MIIVPTIYVVLMHDGVRAHLWKTTLDGLIGRFDSFWVFTQCLDRFYFLLLRFEHYFLVFGSDLEEIILLLFLKVVGIVYLSELLVTLLLLFVSFFDAFFENFLVKILRE